MSSPGWQDGGTLSPGGPEGGALSPGRPDGATLLRSLSVGETASPGRRSCAVALPNRWDGATSSIDCWDGATASAGRPEGWHQDGDTVPPESSLPLVQTERRRLQVVGTTQRCRPFTGRARWLTWLSDLSNGVHRSSGRRDRACRFARRNNGVSSSSGQRNGVVYRSRRQAVVAQSPGRRDCVGNGAGRAVATCDDATAPRASPGASTTYLGCRQERTPWARAEASSARRGGDPRLGSGEPVAHHGEKV